MAPRPTMNHFTDRSGPYMETRGEIRRARAVRVHESDHLNVVGCQAREWMRFALHAVVSTLRDHVVNIVRLRTEKQMIRPDAWRIVATVQHLRAFGDWAERQFPRDSMRQFVSTRDKPELSIALTASRFAPQPACIGFLNMTPKAVANGHHNRLILLGSGA